MDEDVAMRSYLSECLAIVDRVGWMVQGVGAGQDTSGWAYTAGLANFGHQEIAIVGLPIGTMQLLLNELAERVVAGERLRDGQVVNDLIEGYDAVLRSCPVDRPDYRFSLAQALHPDLVVYGLQLVYPDRDGRLPWTEDYSLTGQILI